jgi:C-methyltransferase
MSALTREQLTAMMQAYKTTALLRTAVELGVFDILADRPATAVALAEKCGSDPRGTRILLDALTAVRLLDRDGECYRLPDGAAALLARDSPQYLGDMVKVMSSDWEWDALKRLTEAVRHGGTVLDEHAETAEFDYWVDFAAYASAIAVPTAQVMSDALAPWAAGRDPLRVLDMACGHGIYGYTFCQRNPGARVCSLDWPKVLPVAERHAQRLGVHDRVELLAGDMFTAPLGGPYDLVMITNVLHHFSEKRATELLRRAAEVLRPDGRLALVGFTGGDESPAADPLPYLFSILMLVWTNEGEVHSEAGYHRMLADSGFGRPDVHRVANLPLRVLIAQPARATEPSTVDGVFRVMLRMQVHPGMADEFERAWLAADADLGAEPASLHRWLLRSSTEDGVYFIVSDWVDEEGFRAFEGSATHLAHRAKLHPYRSSGSFTAMRVVHGVAGAAAGSGPR